MRFGLRKRGICNDLQASTKAGTPFGWRVRLFRLVPAARGPGLRALQQSE
jgi:hypothetical protein